MELEGTKRMEPTVRGGTAHPHRCRVRRGPIGCKNWTVCSFSIFVGGGVPNQGSETLPVDVGDGFSRLDGIDLGREAQDVVFGSTLNGRGKSSGNEKEE